MELKDMCSMARKYMRLSQKAFAELIGTNQTEVSFIERGFVPMDANKVLRIEKFYNDICAGRAPDDGRMF